MFVLAAKAGVPDRLESVRVHEVAPGVASILGRRNSVPTGRAAPTWKLAAIRRELTRLAWWKVWNTWFWLRARRVVLRERPRFLYERYVLGTTVGKRLAKEFRLPLILEMNTSFTVRDEWWHEHSPLYPGIVRKAEKRVAEAADLIIVVSSALRRYLIDLGVPEKKIVVMFNGADAERFRPELDEGSRLRARYGLEQALVVGFIGSLKPWHGVDFLIRSLPLCLERTPHVRLLIVGDGPGRPALEAAVQKQGLERHVVFTGAVPHTDAPAYVAAMDIGIYAPSRPKPASPIKLFEYMAAARAVVAVREPDIASIIEDRSNGLLVEPGDEVSLSEAIRELSDDALRARLGAAARRTVEESHTWRGNATEVIRLFEEIETRRATTRSARQARARDRRERSARG